MVAWRSVEQQQRATMVESLMVGCVLVNFVLFLEIFFHTQMIGSKIVVRHRLLNLCIFSLICVVVVVSARITGQIRSSKII